MKPTPSTRRFKPLYVVLGLLALSVAAGVPLGLKYKEASDRAGCIMNQRNIQQAIRGYSCTRGGLIGDPLDKSVIIPEFLSEPHCPSGGTYIWSPTMPAVGTLAAHCSNPKHALSAQETENW
jgi:hypothetical protein